MSDGAGTGVLLSRSSSALGMVLADFFFFCFVVMLGKLC